MKDQRKIFSRLTLDNASREKRPVNEGGAIFLYDVIDPFWGIGAVDVIDAMDSIEGDITLHINSPGGDVFEARAIVSAMRASGKQITAVVDGLAASCASWIATAANKVKIADGAFMMIHKSWTLQMGNADEFRKSADLMDKIDGSIVDEYMKRTNEKRETVEQWMADETWFTASEAVAAKFADELLESKAIEDRHKWNLAAFEKAPHDLLEQQRIEAEQEQRNREMRNRRISLIANGVCV